MARIHATISRQSIGRRKAAEAAVVITVEAHSNITPLNIEMSASSGVLTLMLLFGDASGNSNGLDSGGIHGQN